MAPRLLMHWSLKRAYHQPSRELRNWVVDYAMLRHLQGWENKTTTRMCSDLGCRRGHYDDGWRRTRRKVIIPILREKCDRVGEASVPISACVIKPIFNRVAEQHGMTRRFGKWWIRHFLRCAGIKHRAASSGTKKKTDPKLVDTHVDKLRLRLMHYVTEYGVHPSCIINMDETAAKLLGLGHRGSARPRQDGRVRFIGAADKRNLTISTVVTMTAPSWPKSLRRAPRNEWFKTCQSTRRFPTPSARATGAPIARARS